MPLAGPAAYAIAVYAEAESAEESSPTLLPPAQEQGFEGVACVDDAARAVVLYCLLWQRYGVSSAWTAAHGLLRFLAYMQDADGRFNNFILDWKGHKNVTGNTSYLGGPQWQARALHALSWGYSTFGGAEWQARFTRGLPWVCGAMPYLDVRAVCVLAALHHWQTTGDASLACQADAWAMEIASERSRNSLLNAAGVQPIHLWGHLQETALIETGRLLGRPEFVEIGRASAEALLIPAADWCGTAPCVLPFEVSCIVSGLAAAARSTEDPRFSRAAGQARAWFLGRNSAGNPVYDNENGLVYDGIDQGHVSRNSGAESNIEGNFAMLCATRQHTHIA